MRLKYLIPFLLVIYACSERQNDLKEVASYFSENQPVSGIYRNLDGIYSSLNDLKDRHPEKVRFYEIGQGVRSGRQIPLVRIDWSTGTDPVRLLFVAGTHGNEAAPVEAMMFVLEKLLSDTPVPGNFVLDFVPVHNPDGYAENERENGAGVDLNRDFPVGKSDSQMQPETEALMGLINGLQYKASLFFHSGNEKKYENLVRVPMEFNALGVDAFETEFAGQLKRLAEIVESAGNTGNPATRWRCASDMVIFGGIASDWCSSGFMKADFQHSDDIICNRSHPSLTIELCYPKQPSDPVQLREEFGEMDQIIHALIFNYQTAERK